ncbi:hypothetical protein D0T49_00870 [Paludibacter sp. 221]|uniref:tetratricopeptide repeat protein n=1 Tax=Paludibacter sp. 221 TaxID=2302939 RepID=UPI0013D83BF9|nr:CDC27 family protein [Paludibacter sp. 221]NDV45606.1 hypothetical protein [Paludibacter sp. 221]
MAYYSTLAYFLCNKLPEKKDIHLEPVENKSKIYLFVSVKDFIHLHCMDIAQIKKSYQLILRLLLLGKLKQAFDNIQMLNEHLQNWGLHERFDNLQQNYRYMLQYYVDGVDDPERITIYNKLIAKLFLLTEEIRENLYIQNSSNYEYTKKRYFPHEQKYRNLKQLLSTLQETHAQTTLISQDEASHRQEIDRLKGIYESLLPEIFGIYWLTTTYKDEEKNLFAHIMDKEYDGLLEKSLIVSGLTLNLWRMFDEEKLMLLFDCCESENPQVKQRALVGLCFILTKYNQFIPYFPMVRNRLVLLADNEHTLENFRNIITQIIATTETEKISKKLQEEILPEIAKISPKLKNDKDIENLLNSDDWEETNPQWQEILEDSGVTDKLQELSEMQMEGADVYMSTFSMLKNFPFFNEFSNWFLPFDPTHSAVNRLFQNEQRNVLATFVGSQIMCDSDLYSFCLSILQMPEAQREMMKSSLKVESEQIDEMKKDEAMLSPDVASKNISKQYIQDIFRFFKLYPQRDDFEDMFNSSLLIHRTSLFDILSANDNFKTGIAEYYFSKKLYPQALELFNELLNESEPSASLYQKIGYAYQKTSHLNDALNAYLKADIIQPDDLWTIKKIALCYRLAGNHEKALEFYQHADFLNPGSLPTQMRIANSYMQMGKYKEALNLYFKLDTENEDDIKIQRAIAWASFASGNLKQADYYAQKILVADAPIAHDYLNAGHVAWSRRKRKEALEYYVKSLALQQNNWVLFLDTFNGDIQHLKANGIEPDEIPLMLDEILYNIK